MKQLHIFFLPLMAHGHMIPALDMAKLFTSQGVKTTIIATPPFTDSIKRTQDSGIDIGLIVIKFPPEGSGLPEHIETIDQINTDELLPKFVKAVSLLQEPVEKLLEEFRPNCIVSDMFFPWTIDSAAKFGIPRLVFHGTCFFPLCVAGEMKKHKPHMNLSSDSELFVVPNLPHKITFVRSQLSPHEVDEHPEDPLAKLMEEISESDLRSYGVVVNNFYELEPEYADYYSKDLGRKAWHIGPLFLWKTGGAKEIVHRGKESTIEANKCLAWLDCKKANSVVYVCFGSMASFTPAQLHELATGLESSGQDFVWVVRKGVNQDQNESWLPEGYEERLKEKGLMIRGWAPQVQILNHPSIGAFVTHCGWNSTLEGICAGVPMVTWPLFAEQFFNEKLVTEVLKTGVSVGNMKWQMVANEGVSRDAVSEALQQVMIGEASEEMRSRAKYYKEMARLAVEEGGSSYKDLCAMIQELSDYKQKMI